MPVKIFFCYALEDEPLLNKLKAHLKPQQGGWLTSMRWCRTSCVQARRIVRPFMREKIAMVDSAEAVHQRNPQTRLCFKIFHFVWINDVTSITGNHLQNLSSRSFGYQATH